MSDKTLSRKSYDDIFKVKVALEALSGNFTLSEISSKYCVHSNSILKWKSKFLSGAPSIFSKKTEESAETERLRKENEHQALNYQYPMDVYLKNKNEKQILCTCSAEQVHKQTKFPKNKPFPLINAGIYYFKSTNRLSP